MAKKSAKAEGFLDRLEDLDDWLMATVPLSIQGILFNPKAPKQMKIYDPILGTLEKLFLVGIACSVIWMIASDKESYSTFEIPEGSVLYDIERGNFNLNRNYAFDANPAEGEWVAPTPPDAPILTRVPHQPTTRSCRRGGFAVLQCE